MIFRELRENIYSDLYRYYSERSVKTLLKAIFFNSGYQMCFFYRISNYCLQEKKIILLPFFKILLKISCKVNNCELHALTKIGRGLYLGHCSGIIISGYTTIGNNVNISQQVTIGIAGRGKDRGVPIIGNNVFIGPGAKIFGKISIGNYVAIGANAVVTKDVPDNAVVVGVPGKVISYNGTNDLILNTNY